MGDLLEEPTVEFAPKEESISLKNMGSDSGDETSTKSGGNSSDLEDKKFNSDEDSR